MIDANNNTIPNGANTAIVGADNKSGSGSENKSNAEKEAKNNFLLEFLYSFANVFYLAYRGISYPLEAVFNASSKKVDDAYQQAKFMKNGKVKRDDDLDVIVKKIKDFLGITQKEVLKLEEERRKLQLELQQPEATTPGKPKVYRYKIKNTNGKIEYGTFTALSKMDVNSFLLNAASSLEIAPSATASIEKRLPCLLRSFIASTMTLISYGISGSKMISAPPAIPAYSVSQPTLWPITSTMNTRLWEAAVVWMQSMASVAISTALWKPKVISVP